MRNITVLWLERKARLGFAVLFSLLSLFAAGGLIPAHASTMTVNTSADDNIHNGNCTLREAILASTTHNQVDLCTPGSGNDLIVFAGGLTPNINSPLPPVTANTTIAIYGGSQKTTVKVNSSSGSAFTINAGATLSVQNVNFTGSSSNNCFQSAGSLTLINEQVTACAYTAMATAGSLRFQGIVGGPVDTHTGNVSVNVSGSSFSGGTPFTFYLGVGGATITQSTFTSAQNSNVSITSSGSLNISRTMFNGNGAASISVSGGTTTLTNSIITTQAQGGIDVEGAQVIVTNSTISGNVNGIVGVSGSVHLRNTILANNSKDCNVAGASVIDDGGNMQLLGDCPQSIFTGNPLLGGNFTPGAGSHAIDAALINWCPATDYYGTARPKDGDGNGTTLCDIGAVEK